MPWEVSIFNAVLLALFDTLDEVIRVDDDIIGVLISVGDRQGKRYRHRRLCGKCNRLLSDLVCIRDRTVVKRNVCLCNTPVIPRFHMVTFMAMFAGRMLTEEGVNVMSSAFTDRSGCTLAFQTALSARAVW